MNAHTYAMLPERSKRAARKVVRLHYGLHEATDSHVIANLAWAAREQARNESEQAFWDRLHAAVSA